MGSFFFTCWRATILTTRGGVQWILYSWCLLSKVVIFYWFVFGKDFEMDTSFIGAVGMYSVLFFTPILYCILSFRAARQLYGPPSIHGISLESMLHTDMVVHVMVDLLDLITAFRYADLPDSVRKENNWVHTLVGIVIVVGIFLHSYSFPTTSGQITEQSRGPYQPAHQGDIFLTRKHAALVAMFLVDLPLMIIRTFLWVMYPQNPGFSPFLVKNIMFLPLQAFRLNQCRLAERERAKTTQRIFESKSINKETEESRLTPATRGSSRAAASYDAPVFEAGMPAAPAVSPIGHSTKNVQTIKKRNVAPQTYTASYSWNNEDQKAGSDSMEAATGPHKQQRGTMFVARPVDAEVKTGQTRIDSNNLDGGQADGDAQDMGDSVPFGVFGQVPQTKLESVLRELKSVRQIPVKGFGVWRLSVKIFHCLRVGGRHGLSSLLDESFVLGYWKQIRITLPLILAWSSQIVIVALTYNSGVAGRPTDISACNSWGSVPEDFKLFVYFGCSNLGLMFIFWLGTAPILDVLYVSIMWAARFSSFFLVFTTFRDTKALELQDKWPVSISTQNILIWIFIIVPCVRILDALWPIQSAVLGRKYMHFVVPVTSKTIQTALLTTASTFKDNQLEEDNRARSDESGFVTTSSFLVFLNCRYSLAPMSFGELLIGPDLIKDVRLMDMLVLRSWLELGFVTLFQSIALVLFFSFVNMGIFAGVLLMGAIYNIFIQAIRLLALRRYEVKILFEDIVNAWTTDDGVEVLGRQQDWSVDEQLYENLDDLAFADRTVIQAIRRQKKKRFISLLDVMERYQRHGFFTSPGDLIPNFF